MKKPVKEVAKAREMIDESRAMVEAIRRERKAFSDSAKATKRQIAESQARLKRLKDSN